MCLEGLSNLPIWQQFLKHNDSSVGAGSRVIPAFFCLEPEMIILLTDLRVVPQQFLNGEIEPIRSAPPKSFFVWRSLRELNLSHSYLVKTENESLSKTIELFVERVESGIEVFVEACDGPAGFPSSRFWNAGSRLG